MLTHPPVFPTQTSKILIARGTMNSFPPLAFRTGVLCCLLLVCSGCAFVSLKKEVAEIEQSYALSGRVVSDVSAGDLVVVLLYRDDDPGPSLHQATISLETGDFSTIVGEGTYFLAAFVDENQNLRHDAKEPFGFFGRPDPIAVGKKAYSGGNGGKENPNIRIRKGAIWPAILPESGDTQSMLVRSFARIGEIKSLSDALFSAENGQFGYWRPLSFLKQHGFGIFFLGPYRRDRIPVLFVHGAAGTPADWRAQIESIDREQFHPWVFFYPSGFRLDDIASGLSGLVKRLHEVHGFDTLIVVAHSMGGLVSRAMILKHAAAGEEDYIRTFVSVSTPWAGHRAAAAGVNHAPEAIPSWHDMVPGSPFIGNVLDNPLPSKTRHILFFSFRGDCSPFMANNDGAVELSSQLDYRVQKGAVKIFGFDEDHTGILTSPGFIEGLDTVLKEESKGAEPPLHWYGIVQ
jgi:pimeloyl-ACP methyl ester carboxylesterase